MEEVSLVLEPEPLSPVVVAHVMVSVAVQVLVDLVLEGKSILFIPSLVQYVLQPS